MKKVLVLVSEPNPAGARGGAEQSVSERERARCPAPRQSSKKSVRHFLLMGRPTQKVSDTGAGGGTSERETQAALATLGRATASLRCPSPEPPAGEWRGRTPRRPIVPPAAQLT